MNKILPLQRAAIDAAVQMACATIAAGRQVEVPRIAGQAVSLVREVSGYALDLPSGHRPVPDDAAIAHQIEAVVDAGRRCRISGANPDKEFPKLAQIAPGLDPDRLSCWWYLGLNLPDAIASDLTRP